MINKTQDTKKQEKNTKKPTAKKLTQGKRVTILERQIKQLYDLIVETREVVMGMTQRYEESKIRSLSEWQTLVQIFVKEHGMVEEDVMKQLSENLTKNFENYNKLMQEKLAEFEKQASVQAEKVTEQAEDFLKEESIESPGMVVEDSESKTIQATEQSC